MIAELDVFPHNLAAGNPLIVGDLLYTITGNGVDEGHINIPSPQRAELHRASTRRPASWSGRTPHPATHILHGSWSNPSYGDRSAGKPQVVFPGGDGWLYAFEPKTGKLLWKFDLNPKDAVYELGGARHAQSYVIATPVIARRRGLHRRRPGSRARRGTGPPLGGRRPAGRPATSPTRRRSGTSAARTSTARSRPSRSRTASSTSPTSAGFLLLLRRQDRRSCTGSTTRSPRSGARPSSPTARSTWATRTATSPCCAPGKKIELLYEVNMGAAVYTTPVAKDGVLYVDEPRRSSSRSRRASRRKKPPPPAAGAAEERRRSSRR